jgi:hypothetical protein
MLVVKPNRRRMQYMRDSPAEGSILRRPSVWERVRWQRVVFALGLLAILVVVLFALMHH